MHNVPKHIADIQRTRKDITVLIDKAAQVTLNVFTTFVLICAGKSKINKKYLALKRLPPRS